MSKDQVCPHCPEHSASASSHAGAGKQVRAEPQRKPHRWPGSPPAASSSSAALSPSTSTSTSRCRLWLQHLARLLRHAAVQVHIRPWILRSAPGQHDPAPTDCRLWQGPAAASAMAGNACSNPGISFMRTRHHGSPIAYQYCVSLHMSQDQIFHVVCRQLGKWPKSALE